MATRTVHPEAASELSTDALLACLLGDIDHLLRQRGPTTLGPTTPRKKSLPARNSLFFIHQSISLYPEVLHGTVELLKRSLDKIVGPPKLSFQEFTTVLVNCWALLNSWPLVPFHALSPNGVVPITAGHFLLG